MKQIAIYTLTSALHDVVSIDAATREFLTALHIDHDLQGTNYSDYGTRPLSLIYVRTGGTEGIFKQLLPQLRRQSRQPFYLLTSGKSNSLAASMEILSFLRQQGLPGEILHGSNDYVARRIDQLAAVGEARMKLNGCRLGIVGQPSDWLISSHANAPAVKAKLGIDLVEVPMDELLQQIRSTPTPPSADPVLDCLAPNEAIRQSLPGAWHIHAALRALVERHRLQGFTLRCFDLLTSVRNTGCVALARLNSEGIVAGCEGDVPTMLTMMIVQSLLGVSGFQANPSTIDPETGEILMAHCTIPLNMVERYELDTHFESGIGVGIRGYMREGEVTIFKVSGDLSRWFVAQGTLVSNQAKPDLCRTQQLIQLDDKRDAAYFLTNPIGNHHVVVPGHHAALFNALLAQ